MIDFIVRLLLWMVLILSMLPKWYLLDMSDLSLGIIFAFCLLGTFIGWKFFLIVAFLLLLNNPYHFFKNLLTKIIKDSIITLEHNKS